MALSKSEENMLNIQHQLRENQQDLTDFLKDMDSWENEVKQKDEDLKKSKNIEESKLPPVRNSLSKKKKRKKIKANGQSSSQPSAQLTGKKRISGYDYRSWDKLDVDKMCEDVDKGEDRSASSEYETDEEWELERKQKQAVIEKDRGNDFFKNGDYTSAIEAYTKGIELDPCNPLLPANRAMALLKQQRYAAAETDCLTALTLDPLYIKAHLRLGSARFEMKKFKEAKEVFEKVLLLEPQNKKAKMEIELIEKELIKEQRVTQTVPTADPDAGLVKAITKPLNERSKKPLRRIEIEEVGFEDDHERQMAISRTIESQSETKKNITRKDEQMFEHFIKGDSSKCEHLSATDGISSSNSVPPSQRQFDSQHGGQSAKKIVEIESSVCVDPVKEELKLDISNESKKQHSEPAGSSRSLESVSPRSTDSVSPRSMTVPQTSFQFQADYKNLKSNLENFYQYLKKISPENYPKLFGESLEAGILLNMLTVYKDYFIPAEEDVFPHLLHLTSVKRFSMTVMFFSCKEQQVIKDIFAHLKDSKKVASDDLDKLAKKYYIT